MDLSHSEFRELIVHENSRVHIVSVAAYIGNDKQKFLQLINVMTENSPKHAQKASWVMEHCYKAHPELVIAHIAQLLDLIKPEVHQGVRRAIFHCLENQPMSDDQAGIALEKGFHCLTSATESVAVKAFAMGMLLNLTQEYPELKHELRLQIEAQLPYQSPGYKSKAARVLAALKK